MRRIEQMVKDYKLELQRIHADMESIVNSGIIEEDFFVTAVDTVVDSENCYRMLCHKCNTTKVIPYTNRYSAIKYVCPTCGNDRITKSSSVDKCNNHLYVRITDNGFEGCVFHDVYNFNNKYDENGQIVSLWWQNDAVHTCQVVYDFLFDNVKGWVVGHTEFDDYKVLKKGTSVEKKAIDSIKMKMPVEGCPTSDAEWKIALSKANVFETKRIKDKEAKKNASKAHLLDDMRENYKPMDIDTSKFVSAFPSYMRYLKEQDDFGHNTYNVICTKCGHEFVSDNASAYKCPHCDNEEMDIGHNYYGGQFHSTKVHKAIVFENTHLPENDMLVRLFNIEYKYSKQDGYETSVYEVQRIFFGKKVYVYGCDNYGRSAPGKLEKETVRDISSSLFGRYRTNDIFCVQSDEEIRDIIVKSCLIYSGLAEAWGIGNAVYQKLEDMPSINYLLTWYKNPSIELLVKSNVIELTKHMIRTPSDMGSGKTIADVLQVAPQVAKLAIKHKMDYDVMLMCNRLHNVDNNLTYPVFEQLLDTKVSAQYLIRLRKEFDVTFEKILAYLQSCYDNQCINKPEAASLWCDYLGMARNLSIDMTDKARKFPSSLKKEHDVAMFAYKAIQVELDKKQFEHQAEINSYYEYTYKDLMAVVPKTPQQIVEEATRQHNCLRSYVERVKRGDTVVVFIRKKDTPDETYVTAEVFGGDLTQLKGYCNSNPKDKNLMEFVTHWIKAKNIRVRL